MLSFPEAMMRKRLRRVHLELRTDRGIIKSSKSGSSEAPLLSSPSGKRRSTITGCRDTAMMMSDTEEHKGIRLQAAQSAQPAQAEHSAELCEQVIVQLKTSYDQLLHEPLPEHLLKLLNELDSREDRS